MQIKVSDPPRWLLAAWLGLIGGAGVALFFRTGGVSWAASGMIGGLAAPCFAVVAWWLEPRWRREREELQGGLSTAEWVLARRAAARGPVPTDPEVRAAALRIMCDRSTTARRRPGPRVTTGLGLVMAVSAVGAAFAGSLWALLYAISGGAMLYSGLVVPRQLRRRFELLSTAEPSVER